MRPRMVGGETSDTYIGDSSETPPTASPPRNRARIKLKKPPDPAVAIEVAANSSATIISGFLRPKRLVYFPAINAPSTQPKSSELNAQPSPKSLKENARIRNGPAPVMMAMSNPNSSPPSAAVQPKNIT